VARYVEVYPSRSYTLNRLGDHLPEFLATCSNLPKRDFCVELARLEYALTMVFDARETPPLRPETVQAVPPDAWETVRLQPIEGFRLMAFDYPVSRYLGAVDSENRFPRIVRKKTWVVVYRRNYVLHRMDLSEASYELLAALAADHTIGEAITAVMTRKRHPAVKEAQLFNWFREWMAEGLFQALILSDK
jgi:hypothetical protein